MSDKPSLLKPQWQSQAWKQFLVARDEMLDAYDNARKKNLKRPVKTEHGKVAEAEFRKWLTNFLPKKYGVTSGYIVSQGTSRDESLPHYDVIIYEQLEAPILWIDDSADYSEQGRSLAIPVEYVRGVIEVKSSFNNKTTTDAVKHLAKLKPLMQEIDHPQNPTKLYLPREFFCATVFFELRKEHDNDFVAMDNLLEATGLRGFYGGCILRSEKQEEYYSGKIAIEAEREKVPSSNKSLSFWAYSQSKKIKDNLYYRILLNHCESHFSRFAFDIIALLKGTYHPDVISSLHGFGTTAGENGSGVSIQYYDIEAHKAWEEETLRYMSAWIDSSKEK